MSFIQIDPIRWVPAGIRKQIIDSVVEFIAEQAEKVLGDTMSDALRKLKSDAALQEAFDKGLKHATERFVQEYALQDEDLVEAIAHDENFWQASSVREALQEMLQRPHRWLTKDIDVVIGHFDEVLPQRLNRERVNKAVTFFLYCLAHEVWHLPQFQPIYGLKLQEISIERATEMVHELRGMRIETREAMLFVIANQQKLLPERQERKVYHSLPQRDYMNFVGRQEEFTLIRTLLSPDSRVWIISLDGVGGVGKSALALEAAYHFLQKYDQLPETERFHAIIWASAKVTALTPAGIIHRQQAIRTLEDIYTTIAVTLDQQDILRARPEEQYALITHALKDKKRTLLIIDNLETINDDRVNAFLWDLPTPTKCIVTTRHRIEPAYPIRLTGMKWDEAQALIEQECIKSSTTLTNAEAVKLYDRTGGIPLAIVWSIAQIAYVHNVDSVLHRLGEPNEDVARFCFEGSVAIIRDSEAYRLLMALALFATDTSREAVGIVAGFGSDTTSRDEGLAELEKLSLINKSRDRVSILPLTKEYALVQLQANSVFWQEATERFLTYYIKLVNERYERGDFSGHHLFEIEIPNIRHILSICRTDGRTEIISEIMLGFDVFLRTRGYWNDALEYLLVMLAYANEQSDLHKQAHANRAIGRIYFYRSEYELARKHLEEAYQEAKKAGDVRGALSAADYLSNIYAETVSYSQARKLLRDNLELALSAKNYEAIIRLQSRLAELDIEEGELDEAQDRINFVLALEDLGTHATTVALGQTYLIAGRLALLNREYEKARGFFEQSLSIAQNRGIEQAIAYGNMWLAKLLYDEGQLEEARERATNAGEIFLKIGDKRGLSDSETLLDNIVGGWKANILQAFTKVE